MAAVMNISLAAKVVKAPKVQFRARPTAGLTARPVVVAKAHFGVFAAAVRTFHTQYVTDLIPLETTARALPRTVLVPSSRIDRSREPATARWTGRKKTFLRLAFAFLFAAKVIQPPQMLLKKTQNSRPSTLPPPHPKKQNADTLVKVRTIISEQLGTDLDAVSADAKFVDLGADSLDTVEIMMALEEQFEITLDEEGAE
eukprot:CAMPEP_0117631624 /NCGR_PEP_ID=MMETSP0802-20121206/4137_1 /TAXON_ID=38833 /ORGANISM="Micromonas sp., Strain CCMP2099" /LENGTH=198 /DNA_ID=CAMNT_0005435991 /DNA_START=50 /DNA_END=642 /DNA_ORIENTATION=+